jgi:hypothetical protein
MNGRFTRQLLLARAATATLPFFVIIDANMQKQAVPSGLHHVFIAVTSCCASMRAISDSRDSRVMLTHKRGMDIIQDPDLNKVPDASFQWKMIIIIMIVITIIDNNNNGQ